VPVLPVPPAASLEHRRRNTSSTVNTSSTSNTLITRSTAVPAASTTLATGAAGKDPVKTKKRRYLINN
jgi:hypothetical protein